METWQIDIIKEAFERCYGLKDCLKSLPSLAIHSLSNQTGFRIPFIEKHLPEILKIKL